MESSTSEFMSSTKDYHWVNSSITKVSSIDIDFCIGEYYRDGILCSKIPRKSTSTGEDVNGWKLQRSALVAKINTLNLTLIWMWNSGFLCTCRRLKKWFENSAIIWNKIS